jgi:hypothetical protein
VITVKFCKLLANAWGKFLQVLNSRLVLSPNFPFSILLRNSEYSYK